MNMKKQHVIKITIFALAALLVLCSTALAANSTDKIPVDALVDKFKDILDAGGPVHVYLDRGARYLFWLLATIQLVWNGIQLIFEGRYDAHSFVMMLVRSTFVLAFFYWLLTAASGNFAAIIDGFVNAGKQVSGSSSLREMINIGINVSWGLLYGVWQYNSGATAVALLIMVTPLVVLIFLAYCITVLTYVMGLCKAYLSASIAIYLVGFGGCQFTRDIAITAYKSVLCAALEIFVILVLFGIGKEVFANIASNVQNVTGISETLKFAFQLVMATFVFTGAVKTLPNFISGIVNGSALGGGVTPGAGAAMVGSVAGAIGTGIGVAAGAALGGVGGLKLASSLGSGGWVKAGHIAAGAAKGAFGGEHGVVGNMMRQAGFNAVRRGLDKQHNNLTPPGGNPNNVSPN